MREAVACREENSKEWIGGAVEKMDGNQIVQVACIAAITIVIGAALVSFAGGEMSIGNGEIKIVA